MSRIQTDVQGRRSRRFSAFSGLALGIVMVMITASLALADELLVDGDELTSGLQTSIGFGTVCEGDSVARSAVFYIKRTTNGNPNIFKGDSAPVVSVVSAPAWLSVTVDQVPAGASSVSLPPNWPSLSVDTLSIDTAKATLTLPASTPAGALSGNVVFRATGQNNQTMPATITRDATLSVTATVEDCSPPDTTPPNVTPDISGTLGNNDWYVSDVTVSWTVTDPESTPSPCAPTTVSTDTAGQTVECTSTSAGGSTTASVTIKRDATPPTINGAASPAPNGNGWNNGNVTVSFTCSDGMSGVASCGPNQTLSSDGAGQSASGTATDHAGNSASATVGGINIDKTAPSVTATPSPGPNGNGWNNSAVTVSFVGSDATSGIDYCDPAVVRSGEGAGQSATGSCTDKAGNSASDTATVSIDLTAPSVTATATPPANGNGWRNGAVTVSFTGTDALSGIDTCDPAILRSGEGTSQSATGSCTDKAGNSASDTASDIDIDLTPPTVTATANPAPNGNGWNNGPVTVSFAGTDTLSGIDDCDPAATLSGEGANQSATGVCSDKAGNSASATASGIDIDLTPPTVTATASPAPNGNGWNNGPVTVSFAGSDSLSGLDACDPAVTLSGEGASQSATGSCTDKAGNSASDTETVSIDLANPSVWLVGGPANGASYPWAYVPAAPTCAAFDALSGIDGSCSVSGYGTTVGTHTVTASVTDKAGNSATATATYTVAAWSAYGFYRPVDMGMLNTVKGGSTVPLKFQVLAGYTELTDTWVVKSMQAVLVSCSTNAETAPVEELSPAGSTLLRYDPTAGHFIFNWKTPKAPGKCYKMTLTLQDGSQVTTNFRLS